MIARFDATNVRPTLGALLSILLTRLALLLIVTLTALAVITCLTTLRRLERRLRILLVGFSRNIRLIYGLE